QRLAKVLEVSRFDVPPFSRSELHDAIVKPAQVAGGDFDSVVVDAILNEFADDGGLSRLQYTLNRLWAVAREQGYPEVPRITMVEYERIGRGRALEMHADEAFHELDDPRQRVAETMFRCLTDGEKRRPCSVSEIASVAGVALEQVMNVADAF